MTVAVKTAPQRNSTRNQYLATIIGKFEINIRLCCEECSTEIPFRLHGVCLTFQITCTLFDNF